MSVTRQRGKGRSGNASPIRQLTIKDEREGRDIRHLGLRSATTGALFWKGTTSGQRSPSSGPTASTSTG